MHLPAFDFLIFKEVYSSHPLPHQNGIVEDLHNGWIYLNNNCTDHASSKRVKHTQLMLQTLSAERQNVENVLCLWPLKCHLLSSSDHSSKLFYYSSGSLTSALSFPVHAVIQVTKINIFFEAEHLVCKLSGMRNHRKYSWLCEAPSLQLENPAERRRVFIRSSSLLS